MRVSRVNPEAVDFKSSFGRLQAKVAIIDRRMLFMGPVKWDSRSAWQNTEAARSDEPGADFLLPLKNWLLTQLIFQRATLELAPGDRRVHQRQGRDAKQRP